MDARRWLDSFGTMLRDYPAENLSTGDEVSVGAIFSWKGRRYAVVKKFGSRIDQLVNASDVSMKVAMEENVPYKAQLAMYGGFGEAVRKDDQVVDVLATYTGLTDPLAFVSYNDRLTVVRQDRLRRLQERDERSDDAPKKVRQQRRRRQEPESMEQARMTLGRLDLFDPRADLNSVKDAIIECLRNTEAYRVPFALRHSMNVTATSILEGFDDFRDMYEYEMLERLREEERRLNRDALVTYMENLDVNGVTRLFQRILDLMESRYAHELLECVRYSVDANPSFLLSQRIGDWGDEQDDLSWLGDISDDD